MGTSQRRQGETNPDGHEGGRERARGKSKDLVGEARAGGAARALGHSVNTLQMGGRSTIAQSLKQLDCSVELLSKAWG